MNQHKNPPASSSSSRIERKTIEKNRRNQMKALHSQLFSLVPHQQTTEARTLPDQIDEVVTYIKKLKLRLENMKEKKKSLIGYGGTENDMIRSDGRGKRKSQYSVTESRVEIHQILESSELEIVLTTGPDCQFIFHDTIRVLNEEGADVVNASFSLVNDGDTVLHTIHCKIGGFIPSLEASSISGSLKSMIERANKGY